MFSVYKVVDTHQLVFGCASSLFIFSQPPLALHKCTNCALLLFLFVVVVIWQSYHFNIYNYTSFSMTKHTHRYIHTHTHTLDLILELAVDDILDWAEVISLLLNFFSPCIHLFISLKCKCLIKVDWLLCWTNCY